MRKIVVVFFVLTLCLSSHSIAQFGTGANYLKLGIGPRQMGMGAAFTGVGDDLYTIYWNPGGLGLVRRWEISAMYNKYFADMYYGALTGVKQFRILGSRKTTAGIGLFFHGMPEWDSTEGQVTEKGSASNIMMIGSFGQRMDWLTKNLSAGINAKIGYSKLASYDAFTLATDFGVMYRFDVWNKPLTVGFTAQNIGIQTAFITEKTSIPLGFRFGASYRMLGCPNHCLLIATDVAKYKFGTFKVGFGAEYWFRGIVGLRGGYTYNQDDLGDFSFGASVGIDAFNTGSQLDYSQTDFGNTLEYDRKFAYSIHTVSPEPFRLFTPASGEVFCKYHIISLEWENSEDPDWCDQIAYRILIDTDENEVKKAVTQVCTTPKKKSNVLFDFATDTTVYHIVENIRPDTYYWTIIAVDKKSHTQWADEIRSFTKSASDLIISDIRFMPNEYLPDIDDDFQGTIRIILQNLGKCKAYDFQIELRDSFYCTDQSYILKEFQIDSIGAGQIIEKYYPWYTNEIGKHRFSAIVDPYDKIGELKNENNQNSCLAITIPRGRVIAEKDTLDTKKIIFTYSEIPIVPIVFFDTNSVEVSEEFYVEDPIRPIPMLKVIADRLNLYRDVNIELAGYIDPVSETGKEKLAQERVQKVYSILVDSLRAPSDRVKLKRNYKVTQRRVERIPEPMVNAENRRVEILFDSNNPEEILQLFGPIEIVSNPRISDGLAFEADVIAYVDIVCWQLILKDIVNKKAKIVYRTPLKIDPKSNTYDMHDRTVWVGNDKENKLVELNHSYVYEMKIQDKFGRDFYTSPKRFYLKCDFVEEQQLQVHLNQFDSPDELYLFGDKRLMQLADKLCKLPSMKIKFNGYACDIGTFDYNLNLAYNRADSFQTRLLRKLKQKCGELSSTDKVQKIPSKDELREKHAGYPGSFAEPIKYYNSCTLKEYIFPIDNAYGRNLSRRVDIILYHEKEFKN